MELGDPRIPQKFWDKVVPVPESGCWLWEGASHVAGYGVMLIYGKRCHAHRLTYEISKGKIPDGLVMDHLCRVPACCNPRHLEPVTVKENAIRGFWGSKTTCKNGHPYTAESYRERIDPRYGTKIVWRVCWTCHRNNGARWDRENRRGVRKHV